MRSRGGPIPAKLAVLTSLALLALQVAATAQQSAKEDEIKAAFLLNFAKLGQWPGGALPDGPSPLVICVNGGDEAFLNTLKALVTGKVAGTHALEVKSVSLVEEMKTCNMVFFRASEKKRAQAAIESLVQTGLLLVGEDDSFLRQGGMINLVRDHGSIRFEIDSESLDRSQIRFGSKILMLAKSSSSAPARAAPEPTTDAARQVTYNVPPEYPELAEKMKLSGTVQVKVLVKPDGTVKDVKIIGGHPLLADALARAVKQWKYQPGAKETTETVKFSFSPN
jgi:TonB family protein